MPQVLGRGALLIGRAASARELDESLLDLLRDRRKPRIVTVLGGGGLGKSRFVADFIEEAAKREPGLSRIVRSSARPHDAAYGVITRLLRARFGLEGLDPKAAQNAVRGQVSAVLEDRKVGDVCYFLGQLLGLEFEGSPLVSAVAGDPQEMRSLRRAVLRRFFEADAGSNALAPIDEQGPLTVVLDDLHLAHDDSLDLLEHLLDSVEAPLFVLCIARPELLARREGWARRGSPNHRIVTLSPLEEPDAAAVMRSLLGPCGDQPGTDDLVASACELAGGNPALLERMVRIYFDLGVLSKKAEGGWAVDTAKLDEAELPLTVEDAVAARIASIDDDERTLLEQASLIGSVFWLGGLEATRRQHADVPEIWIHEEESEDAAKIRSILARLVERDYLLRLPDSTFAGDEEYVFKHNLEREALLRLVPKSRARAYHRALADWLSFQPSTRESEEGLAMLARHREAAGFATLAATTYMAAGDLATASYANAKAFEHYRKGLELAEATGEIDADVLLETLHNFGGVTQAMGRNDEALSIFRDMLVRAYRYGHRGRGGAALSKIGRLYRETGHLDEANQHLDAALALFEIAADERGIASTLDDLGKLAWIRGDYRQALDLMQQALGRRRQIGDRRSIALSFNNLGLVYQDSGQFKHALDAFEQALRIRREIGDLVGVSVTLNNLGVVAQDQREDARSLDLFLEAYDVAKETGDRNRLAMVLANLGETYNRLGDTARAIDHLSRAETLCDELGDALGLAETLRSLGKAYLTRRDFTRARECTERAVDLFRQIQSKVQLGSALRALGQVMAEGAAGGRDHVKARGHLLQSIWIFEEVGNEVELARSCRVYAALLERSPEHVGDGKTIDEAKAFRARSEEIYARLRLSSLGLDAEAFFAR